MTEFEIVERWEHLVSVSEGQGFTLARSLDAHAPCMFAISKGTWGPRYFDNLERISGYIDGWSDRETVAQMNKEAP